jgi:hypothetical protein
MAEFDAKLKELEQRLLNVEAGEKVSSVSDEDKVSRALNEYKLQIVGKLRDIRSAMDAENSSKGVSGDVKAVEAERDAALVLVKKQQVEIDRLKYRVGHLVKALNEEESKHQ